MMGQLTPDQNALFYDFCLENYVPQDHLLRQINPFLDLSDLREKADASRQHHRDDDVDWGNGCAVAQKPGSSCCRLLAILRRS